jgi:hypothetical protein
MMPAEKYPRTHIRAVVPNHSDAYIVRVWGQRVSRVPVVAWRVELIEYSPMHEEEWCTPMPAITRTTPEEDILVAGELIEWDETSFDTLDEAIASAKTKSEAWLVDDDARRAARIAKDAAK